MPPWIDSTDQLPDDDQTVIIYDPSSNEPIWFGYLEAGQWYSVEGMKTKATHWMSFPDPPGASDPSEKSDPSDPEETLP